MAELPYVSLARMLNETVPTVLGTPLICPVLPRLKPAGRIPEYVTYVYGGVPPVTPTCALYDEPTVAAGKLLVRKLTAPPEVEIPLTVAVTVPHWLMFVRLHTVRLLVPLAIPYMLRLEPEMVELTMVGLEFTEM
jgi:hypothetical protein